MNEEKLGNSTLWLHINICEQNRMLWCYKHLVTELNTVTVYIWLLNLILGVGDIDKNWYLNIFFQYLDIDIQTIFLQSFKEMCANWQRRSSWSFDFLHLTYYCIELLVHKDMRHYWFKHEPNYSAKYLL